MKLTRRVRASRLDPWGARLIELQMRDDSGIGSGKAKSVHTAGIGMEPCGLGRTGRGRQVSVKYGIYILQRR